MGTFRNKLPELRAKRGTRGINKAQLARQIGVSRSYITRLEQGRVNPSAEVMFRLADFLGCSVEDVFQYVREPDRST